MSLFAPQKMSLNESKNWASKSRRLKDSCLANTLVVGDIPPDKPPEFREISASFE